MVVFGVVGDDDYAAPAVEVASPKKAQKVPCGQCIEAVEFARKNEFAVAKAHGTEIANALARGVM